MIATTPENHLTLFDLQRIVRATLEERFALPLWISAEISEIKVNYSGHCYINLVEKGSGEGTPRAEARAVIWRSAYTRLASYFESQTGTRLAAGIRILAKVMVIYHEVYGFSLQITDIDPSYTLGDVERRRQQTIRTLHEDGVWDMNRELRLPRLTARIAVVSSATAAGYRDFMREIGSCGYALHATLFDSVMQGAAAEDSIVASLEAVAAREEEFDAVVIIRGGGSTSDLSVFDSYRIASHTAQFPLPVITGIGHDKDVSIVDMVAHTSLKTPTAVAVWLGERMAAEEERLAGAARELRSAAAEMLNEHKGAVERAAAELQRSIIRNIVGESARLDMRTADLYRQARHLVEAQRRRLDAAQQIADSRKVENILRLGFAVVRAGSHAVVAAGELRPGSMVDITFAEGRATAEVVETKHR
ncbi:MAG: exodeoxyribonuclease VII large subunit [Alistipes sp.]